MTLLELTDDNFKKEVLESDLPVLVDFWASWCVPCKMILPILEELSREYEGRIKIGKLNVEDNSRVPTSYGVMAIPTLIFFKAGSVMTQVVGALSRLELKRKIEENIS